MGGWAFCQQLSSMTPSIPYAWCHRRHLLTMIRRLELLHWILWKWAKKIQRPNLYWQAPPSQPPSEPSSSPPDNCCGESCSRCRITYNVKITKQSKEESSCVHTAKLSWKSPWCLALPLPRQHYLRSLLLLPPSSRQWSRLNLGVTEFRSNLNWISPTFLLDALVEKAAGTFNQGNWFELRPPKRGTNLEDRIKATHNMWALYESPLLWVQGHTWQLCQYALVCCTVVPCSSPPTPLSWSDWKSNYLIKNSITINFKDKGNSMYLCKAPCSVICSLTTMSQIDPVSGSSLADNERFIQEDTLNNANSPKPA